MHALVSGHHACVFTGDNHVRTQKSEALEQQLIITAIRIQDFHKSRNIQKLGMGGTQRSSATQMQTQERKENTIFAACTYAHT